VDLILLVLRVKEEHFKKTAILTANVVEQAIRAIILWCEREFQQIHAEITSLIKILPLGVELFHADRQTDIAKLTVAFRNFANAPENGTEIHTIIFV
jgi:hypothetical protein